jgi:hypothetical protein
MEDPLASFEKKYTGTISPSIAKIFSPHLLGNTILTSGTFKGNTTLYWHLSKYHQVSDIPWHGYRSRQQTDLRLFVDGR